MIYLLLGVVIVGLAFIYAENKVQSTQIADIRQENAELHQSSRNQINAMWESNGKQFIALSTQIAELREMFESKNFSDVDDLLTPYERERLTRERAFDTRIANLNKELDEKHGHIAEELHPLVHNLPHDIIDRKVDDLPDVEFAD